MRPIISPSALHTKPNHAYIIYLCNRGELQCSVVFFLSGIDFITICLTYLAIFTLIQHGTFGY